MRFYTLTNGKLELVGPFLEGNDLNGIPEDAILLKVFNTRGKNLLLRSEYPIAFNTSENSEVYLLKEGKEIYQIIFGDEYVDGKNGFIDTRLKVSLVEGELYVEVVSEQQIIDVLTSSLKMNLKI